MTANNLWACYTQNLSIAAAYRPIRELLDAEQKVDFRLPFIINFKRLMVSSRIFLGFSLVDSDVGLVDIPLVLDPHVP